MRVLSFQIENTEHVTGAQTLGAPKRGRTNLTERGIPQPKQGRRQVREHHSSCLKWLPLALLGVSQDERQHWPQASQVPANPIQWALVGYPRTLGC